MTDNKQQEQVNTGQASQAGSMSSASSSMIEPGKATAAPSALLELPGEILSQIAGHLPLDEQIRFLSLHPSLLDLTKTHLSPLPPTIRAILGQSTPYPRFFSRLPTLSLYVPDDGGRCFIDMLVRARPKWILERLEHGRWRDALWQEAFERRFLRSWRRYKLEDDTWRSTFLRMLGRLEHRSVGCTHDESWTRFVTLNRNGSASINRIYSRSFNPYEIYDELKHQNNFSDHPTTIRVVLHLQDVRILAVGTLISNPSIFVNPNAHLALHPPLLRSIAPRIDHPPSSAPEATETALPSAIALHKPLASVSPAANANEAYFSLVRSISPSGPAQSAYGIGESAEAGSPSNPSLLSAFARVLPGRRRQSSTASDDDGWRNSGLLTRALSRESYEGDSRRRTWSFGRSRGSTASISSTAEVIDNANATRPTEPPSISTPAMPTLPETSPVQDTARQPLTPPHTPPPMSAYERRKQLPYPTLLKPQPDASYRHYPNFPLAPLEQHTRDLIDKDGRAVRGDRRLLHEEIEDAGIGAMWSASESAWGGDGRKMAEWSESEGVRRRWVGPMLIIAQIHPSDRESALPAGAALAAEVEGSEPDLGSLGTYASLGFEDIEDLFPWVELRGGGAHSSSATRGGLGFE